MPKVIRTFERTDQRIVTTRPMVERKPGKVVARDVTWRGDVLTARLEREQVCRDYLEDEVELQDVRVTETKNVWGAAVVGLGMLAAGGVLVGVAGGQSTEHAIDPETGKEQISDRDATLLSALAVGGLGALSLADAVTIGRRGGVRHLGPPRTTREEHDHEPARVCGHDAPPPGHLVLAFGDDIVDVDDDLDLTRLEIDLRASTICDDEARLGVPLTVTWDPVGLGAAVAIATHDVDACIRSSATLTRLVTAATTLEDATNPAALVAVSAVLDEAEERLAALPVDDGDRADLVARLAVLRGRAKVAVERLLDERAARYQQILDEQGADAALAAAAEVVALGATVPGRELSTWRTVHAAFAAAVAKRGGAAAGLVWQLLARDPRVMRCLERGPGGCPTWLSVDAIAAVVVPTLEAAARDREASPDEVGRTLAVAATLPNHERAVWDAVYHTLAPRLAGQGSTSLPLLLAVLGQDRTTARCLWQQTCPAWLDRDAIVVALGPLTEKLTAELVRLAADLDGRSRRLARRVTEKTYVQLGDATRAAAAAIDWCATPPMWDDRVVDACAALRRTLTAAGEVEAVSAPQVTRLRGARAARSWRAIFPTCRKVQGFLEGVRREGGCTGECRSIARRVEADWERLNTFTVDAEVDEQQRERVRAECAEAGCPRCP